MRRKITVFALCTLLITLCIPVEAQQRSEPVRIGWISNDRGVGNAPMFAAFREGMRQRGYVEGRDVIIESRWGEGSNERLDRLAGALVKSDPQLIDTHGGTANKRAVS